MDTELKQDSHKTIFTLATLYKRDYRGKPCKWEVSIEQSKNNNYRLAYKYGVVEQTTVVSHSDYIKAKNIGKSNQTTLFDQAMKEAKSAHSRQLKKGYKYIDDIATKEEVLNNIDDLYHFLDDKLPKYNTDANNVCKPMKCQKFQLGKMKYHAILQPKINGVRCIILYKEITEGEGMFATTHKQAVILSKEGLRYDIKHIEYEFTKFYENIPEAQNIVFDGELYIKGKPVTTIGGAARNKYNEFHKDIKFVCFDLAIPDISNANRDNIRFNMTYYINCYCPIDISDHHKFDKVDKPVIFLNSIEVHDDNEVLDYRDICIKEGYEGCVVRDKDAEYCFGQRPMSMMKCKKFDDAEFEIIDIKCRGNAYEKVGFTIIYLLKNDINDLQFECNGSGTVEDKLDIFNNKDKYIGKQATVKFYERTKNGLPFHANVIAIRDYETPNNY